jgi:hypothetical protein
MKRLLGCAAIAMIAVLLAPLISDSGVMTSAAKAAFVNGPLIAALERCATLKPSCRGGDGVCAKTRGMNAVPALMLWAWERPEDLRFLDPERAGVAFLAGTVRLGPKGMTFKPRMQPLRISPQTKLVAVVRIETAVRDSAAAGLGAAGTGLDSSLAQKVAAEIARAADGPQVVAAQVDFDATVSERAFYREVLVELRQRLPAGVPISITALASWCIGDPWLAGLPVDEAVPMLFRMGTGQGEVSSFLRSGKDFREPVCRGSLGVSLDEPWTQLAAGRRVYVFSPTPWMKQSFQELSPQLQLSVLSERP